MYYNVTMRCVRVTNVAVEKQQEFHILNVCVCSLSYPAWKHMHHIVVCGLPCSTTFFRIISKRHDFRKKKKRTEMCVLIFSTVLSRTFLILRISERDMIKNV